MEHRPKNVSPFSNEARNTYVLEHVTTSMLRLLQEKPLEEISVSELCDDAGVGRTSYYRNFQSKEDIIRKYIRKLINEWRRAYKVEGDGSNAKLFGSFFQYLKDHADFFLLLKRRGLMHLFLEVFIEENGASPEDDNMGAYTKAFVAYGTYGWIEEWIARGMQESAETMASLLSAHGMQ
jgi:AcrR family transcriptional regulator